MIYRIYKSHNPSYLKYIIILSHTQISTATDRNMLQKMYRRLSDRRRQDLC